jgi:hypothetical protein
MRTFTPTLTVHTETRENSPYHSPVRYHSPTPGGRLEANLVRPAARIAMLYFAALYPRHHGSPAYNAGTMIDIPDLRYWGDDRG